MEIIKIILKIPIRTILILLGITVITISMTYPIETKKKTQINNENNKTQKIEEFIISIIGILLIVTGIFTPPISNIKQEHEIKIPFPSTLRKFKKILYPKKKIFSSSRYKNNQTYL